MIIGPSTSTEDTRRVIDILVSHNNLHTPATTSCAMSARLSSVGP